MNITKNHVVMMAYTLKNDSGEVLDSSQDKEPLAYIQGHGQILNALEQQIEGKAKGAKLAVDLTPEQGYGVYQDGLRQAVPKEMLRKIPNLEIGMQLSMQSDEGMQVVTVADIGDKEVILDGNHPLAGVPLHFDIEIIDFRDATQEELAHGHVHGPGGHHH